MARIRTIKPEFWSSEQVMECSTNTRLLFIGMWNFADDHGRMTNSAKRIKAQIFPSDDISSENVRRMIDELSDNDLVNLYSIENVEYIQITGWKHQKIDKPQPSKIPPPPTNTHGSPGGGSSNGRRMVVDGREGKGEEWKGKKEPNSESVHLTTSPGMQAGNVFDLLEKRLCDAALPMPIGTNPDISAMSQLIANGFSLELDILPAIEAAKREGKRFSTWDRLIGWVETQNAGRLKAEKAKPSVVTSGSTKVPVELTIEDLRRIARNYVSNEQWPFHDMKEPGKPGSPVTLEMIAEAKVSAAEERRRMIANYDEDEAQA